MKSHLSFKTSETETLMRNRYTIRLIEEKDCNAVLDIYTYYVLNTVITFEYKVPSEEDYLERIKTVIAEYPWLVCLENNVVVGYAYAGRHRYKEAYDWSVESTIYLTNDAHRKGIGSVLYQTLFSILKLQGYYNVYAGVVYPNEKSEAFHLSQGFEFVCDFKKIGFKFNQWQDLRWFQLFLADHTNAPKELIKIHDEALAAPIAKILAEANAELAIE